MDTGCFHILAVLSSVAVNTEVHISFQLIFFLDIYPGVELLGHMVALFYMFWETFIQSCIMAAPNHFLCVFCIHSGQTQDSFL